MGEWPCLARGKNTRTFDAEREDAVLMNVDARKQLRLRIVPNLIHIPYLHTLLICRAQQTILSNQRHGGNPSCNFELGLGFCAARYPDEL
jgi:hypothetical protein